MNALKTAKLFGLAFLPITAHRHGLATAGAMLTCVAVALNVPPFTSPKKLEGFPVMAGGPTGAVAEQPNGSSASLETVAPVSHEEPLIEVTDHATKLLDEFPLALESAAAASPPGHPNSGDDETVTTFVGVWAPDAGTCSAREFRDGVLPAVIRTDGAWAGETFCMFTNKKQTETGWNVVAKCSNPRERWTANVRLTVKDNRLTWTSKRGAQAYTRCAPDVLMAAAR
jgi:hypothetical protein